MSTNTNSIANGLHHSRQSVARVQRLIYSSKMFNAAAPNDQNVIASLLEDCPRAPADSSLGYLHLRLSSGVALNAAVHNCIVDGSIDPREARFATFSFKDGITDIDQPLADLQRQLGRIDKLCREFGLSAIIFPDIEVMQYPGYAPPLLAYHHHAIVWPISGEPIKPRSLSKAMNKRLVGQTLIIPAVEISPKLAGQSAVDRAMTVAGYATKVTCRIKTVSYDDTGKAHVVSSREDVSGTMALRVLHAWSLLDVLENVRGIGQGTAIRKAWKDGIQTRLAKSRLKPGLFTTPDQLADQWQRFWAKVSNKPLSPLDQAIRDRKFDAIAVAAEFAGDAKGTWASKIKQMRAEIVQSRRGSLADL